MRRAAIAANRERSRGIGHESVSDPAGYFVMGLESDKEQAPERKLGGFASPVKPAAACNGKGFNEMLWEKRSAPAPSAEGFVHAKVFVSDACRAVVGTINLDYRSLYHHFECATYLYRTPCIVDIEADFAETLSKCREVTDESIKNETLSYKLMGSLMKIIAPLM